MTPRMIRQAKGHREVVALEYRQQGGPVQELVERVERVSDACAKEGVEAIGMAGLMGGQVEPLRGGQRPALLVGLRATTMEGAVGVADALSQRGYSAVIGAGSTELEQALLEIEKQILWGLGAVVAKGAYWRVRQAGPAALRRRLGEYEAGAGNRWWMPGLDEEGMGIEGLGLEEARRQAIAWIWRPGVGINDVEGWSEGATTVVEARWDDGSTAANELAQWVGGQRWARRKQQVEQIQRAPRQWIKKWTHRVLEG